MESLLTPEEAKKEDCPLTSQLYTNRNGEQQAMLDFCRGPDCKMGWRWEKKKETQCASFDKCKRTLGIPPCKTCMRATYSEFKTGKGYCGAFGKP